jgi:hypothetical protein
MHACVRLVQDFNLEVSREQTAWKTQHVDWIRLIQDRVQ